MTRIIRKNWEDTATERIMRKLRDWDGTATNLLARELANIGLEEFVKEYLAKKSKNKR
jgi:hypothetical protein